MNKTFSLQKCFIHCNMKQTSKKKLAFFSSLVILNQLTDLNLF